MRTQCGESPTGVDSDAIEEASNSVLESRKTVSRAEKVSKRKKKHSVCLGIYPIFMFLLETPFSFGIMSSTFSRCSLLGTFQSIYIYRTLTNEEPHCHFPGGFIVD